MHSVRTTFWRLLCCAFAPLVVFAAPFEGTIDMAIKEGRQSQTIRYATKDGQMRISMASGPMGEMSAIVDMTQRQMLMLMPEQSMYMVVPFAAQMDKALAGQIDSDTQLKKTDETATLLGYPCTKYIYEDEDGPVEIWGTDQLGQFMTLPSGNPLQQTQQKMGWDHAITGDFFPLRVVALNKKGKERLRWEATAVTPQKLDATLFEVPAGYRKFDMGNLMQGLGGLMGGN